MYNGFACETSYLLWEYNKGKGLIGPWSLFMHLEHPERYAEYYVEDSMER